MAATTKPAEVIAKEAIVIVVGARPPVFRKEIVRDRRTGLFREVELNEFEPIDPGDLGTTYTFKAGERVQRDHEAVLDCPGGFREAYPNEL